VTPAEPTPLPRCADTARERLDPLIGTAPPALRWLLIEHPGPWRIAAMASAPLRGVSSALQEACTAHHARPLLIRRHGRTPARQHLRWGVVDAITGRSLWGTWAAVEDLWAAVAAVGRPSETWSETPPMLLVCTHATHDVCCALRGRPVAAALQEHWPSQTWECSHLGGDRFAANVVVLPDGVVYGNLDEASAVDVVARHLDGEVSLGHLRGTSAHSPPMQAALGYVIERGGPRSFGQVHAHGLRTLAEDRWRAELRVDGAVPSDLTVVVTRSWRPAARLTCRAVTPTDAATYTVSEAASSGIGAAGRP
jgi:hypothetical protein